ncbi:hypothetical protein WMY93_021468 [Mugilogobius chulae]|uniref:Reverse transcriptase domain-containing protein n=1 Tax=Mugilogobius chulae TaxID=88201 RepID=A0AAW0NHZ2_9GOBI
MDNINDRPKFVRMGGSPSSTLCCSLGAPQGTVLSPVLFTLYTSNFHHNPEACHMQTFLDNTVIVASIKEDKEREPSLPHCVEARLHGDGRAVSGNGGGAVQTRRGGRVPQRRASSGTDIFQGSVNKSSEVQDLTSADNPIMSSSLFVLERLAPDLWIHHLIYPFQIFNLRPKHYRPRHSLFSMASCPECPHNQTQKQRRRAKYSNPLEEDALERSPCPPGPAVAPSFSLPPPLPHRAVRQCESADPEAALVPDSAASRSAAPPGSFTRCCSSERINPAERGACERRDEIWRTVTDLIAQQRPRRDENPAEPTALLLFSPPMASCMVRIALDYASGP